MSAVFFGITDRVFTYSHVIGRNEYAGPGFRQPMDLALAANDVIYVLNRSSEYRPDGVRITVCNFGEDYISEFGSYGEGDGQLVWPTSIGVDSQENVYVSDEWLNQITVYSKDGAFIRKWGKTGSGSGELDKPAGLTIGSDQTMYLVDSRNHRVQKFSLDGEFLGQFGSFGNGPDQLNLPWGIALDKDGLVYVADWRNDRVQQFTSDGEHQATFGMSGSGAGQFNRPTGVSVDQDGDIYVADWMNNRVQVLTPDGRLITEFLGEAGISKWGMDKLAANPDMIRQRRMIRDFTAERVLWAPVAVKVDAQGRIAVLETARHRIQVYQKLRESVPI